MKKYEVGECAVLGWQYKKKIVVQNWLKSSTKGNLVQLVFLPYTISVTSFYNGIKLIHMYKLCPRECMNYVSNGLTFKMTKKKIKCYFILFSMQNIIKNKTKKLFKNYYLT